MDIRQEYKLCNIAIWLFFFLLIFEGAFRKWILPSLSDVFLVIRDPIALFIVCMACKRGLWRNGFVVISWGIAFITFITTLMFGHQNLFIALYGVRIWVYYIPLIFAVPIYLTVNKVLTLSKYTLFITIGMAILLYLQYFSPPTSLVNIGVGGTGSSTFAGVGSYFRPSGTFSFTMGVSTFMTWAGCCLLIYYFSPQKRNSTPFLNSLVWWTALACFLASVPISLSRGVVAATAILFIWTLVIVSLNARYRNKLWKLSALLLILLPVLSLSPRVQIAIDNMQHRFIRAEKAEGDFVTGSIVQRSIVDVFDELLDNEDVPFFYGRGIGLSTNVAAVLLTGKKQFLTREGGSDLMENGYLMGSFMFIYKWILLFYILYSCIKVRRYSLLPLLFAVSVILGRPGTGQTPTSVGFNNFTAAITLTLALRTKREYINPNGRNICYKP